MKKFLARKSKQAAIKFVDRFIETEIVRLEGDKKEVLLDLFNSGLKINLQKLYIQGYKYAHNLLGNIEKGL
jgi:hypothetical protein